MTVQPSNIILRAQGSQYDGQYLSLLDDGAGGEFVGLFVTSRSAATTLLLDSSTGYLGTASQPYYYANTDNQAQFLLYFNTADDIGGRYVYLVCTVDPTGSGMLTCTRNGVASIFEDCSARGGLSGSGVVISTGVNAQCVQFNFVAELP
jgi:hypothetical protein